MYGMMKVRNYNENEEVKMKDHNYLDFLYVYKGSLKIEMILFVNKDETR